LFANDHDDARPSVEELLGIEAVIVPCPPVVAGSLDNRIAPEVHIVEVDERTTSQDPDDVFVK
jgi:hypothetical protein